MTAESDAGDVPRPSVVHPRVAAIVLAGGRSRRFGSDKLAAHLDGVALIDHAVGTLPDDWLVIMVGPPRRLDSDRKIITVREQPPGSGPAAALVTGFRTALDHGIDRVVTLPGDAPGAGIAAVRLVDELSTLGPDAAVVGVDAEEVEQPLQLALSGSVLHRLAARTDVADFSARNLLPDLGDYRRLRLPAELVDDVDTLDDLARLRRSQAQ
ncbi:molybdenum cofactor guanylyltransferase [Microlunatus elymi]|uniref:molybdenum cofactor guanylyltransferase n=1 Tax=Microlunatus elymi TaxID=2596828 RepID=UPI00143E09C6|nr:NTP transferase domain-containing protein [Microlunatus elymi]